MNDYDFEKILNEIERRKKERYSYGVMIKPKGEFTSDQISRFMMAVRDNANIAELNFEDAIISMEGIKIIHAFVQSNDQITYIHFNNELLEKARTESADKLKKIKDELNKSTNLGRNHKEVADLNSLKEKFEKELKEVVARRTNRDSFGYKFVNFFKNLVGRGENTLKANKLDDEAMGVLNNKIMMINKSIDLKEQEERLMKEAYGLSQIKNAITKKIKDNQEKKLAKIKTKVASESNPTSKLDEPPQEKTLSSTSVKEQVAESMPPPIQPVVQQPQHLKSEERQPSVRIGDIKQKKPKKFMFEDFEKDLASERYQSALQSLEGKGILTDSLSDLQNALENVKTQIKDLDAEHKKNLAPFVQELTGLRNVLLENESALLTHSERVNKLKQEKVRQKSERDKLPFFSAARKTMSASLNALNKEIKSMEEKVKVIGDNIIRLTSKRNRLEGQREVVIESHEEQRDSLANTEHELEIVLKEKSMQEESQKLQGSDFKDAEEDVQVTPQTDIDNILENYSKKSRTIKERLDLLHQKFDRDRKVPGDMMGERKESLFTFEGEDREKTDAKIERQRRLLEIRKRQEEKHKKEKINHFSSKKLK